MPRNYKRPVERVIPEGATRIFDNEFDHDAFGVVTLSSVTCGGSDGGVTLAGSELRHNHTMRVAVHRGYQSRGFGENTIRSTGGRPIVEFDLSEAQWARFVSSQGWGGGTPCTLIAAPARGTPIEVMPDIEPMESPKQAAQREVRERAADLASKVNEALAGLRAAMARPSVRKGDIEAAISGLQTAAGHFAGNQEFYLHQFDDVIEKTVSDAQTEIETFVNRVAVNTGIAALRDGAAPVLMLPDAVRRE